MTSPVSKLITKILCDHQGCLDFQTLDQDLSRHFTVDKSLLRSVLFDDGKIAIEEGRRRGGGHILSPDSLLVAKTPLRLCQRRAGECVDCGGLHLCRYYVCGDCTFGLKCNKPHSLLSPGNAELLRTHGLEGLTEKQLFQLLLQNDPFLLPEVCPHYNKGEGQHGSCRFGTTCTKLHVCLHHLQGDCKFGSACKRTHRISAQELKIFRGFSQENINNLYKLYRNRLIIMGHQEKRPPADPRKAGGIPAVVPKVRTPAVPPPPHSKPRLPSTSAAPSKPMSDDDRDEICLYFIRRNCSFQDKCARVHWHLPYRWQVLDSDGVKWKDLPCMEDIEKAYCDPGQDTSCADEQLPLSGIFKLLSFQSSSPPAVQSVNFITMTHGGSPVRRLSTASSASKPPHYILTTEWLWYWKSDSGAWLEFGQSDSDTPASITSQTLENVYLAERDTEIPFGCGKHQYILHFKGEQGTQGMYQQNVKYKTKREVKRRPRFVSSHDVEVKLSPSSLSSSSSSTADSFPAHWDKTAVPEFGYRLVLLSNSDKDHSMIEKLFRLTMPHSRIKKIQRIQNPSLWKVFHWQKEQMKVRNGGKEVNMQYLFHGTDEQWVEAICEQNFDWRVCGVHGTAYGKGSYFAKDASYSDKYAKIKKDQNKIMFVALVLVGEYTNGSSHYVRPPAKGNGRNLYDSCVDRQSNPGIFVIFEKQQIYPEYLITYS